MALLNHAQAYCEQGLFAVAKMFAEACGFRFTKEEDKMSYGGYAVVIFNDLSIFYKFICERETAMSYLEKLMTMTENKRLPLKLLSNVTARYFLLICKTGIVKEGVPYLELAVQSLKESFGSKHFEVGNVYLHLGFAYLILREPETTEKLFTDLKEIMDASVGPHHEKAIQACQGLFSAYERTGRYTQAIKEKNQGYKMNWMLLSDCWRTPRRKLGFDVSESLVKVSHSSAQFNGSEDFSQRSSEI